MPPIIKVYEAFGALADGRVRLADECHASVVSSDRTKTYKVEISSDGRTISSDDNGSYWQGYLGYPAIAVMLRRGLCPVREEAINALSGIPWKELNRRFRNDYSRTIDEVMRRAQQHGLDPDIIKTEGEAALRRLRDFAPLRGSWRRAAQPTH